MYARNHFQQSQTHQNHRSDENLQFLNPTQTLQNLYDNFDVAVIASGDRDYIPVINEIKKMGKEVVLASFKYSMSQAIRDTANKVIELDDHISEITKQTFNYTCEDCGKDFFMTFELHGTTRCPDCHKKHLASRAQYKKRGSIFFSLLFLKD